MIAVENLLYDNTKKIDINFMNKMIANFQNMTSQFNKNSDVEHLRNLFKQFLNTSEKSMSSSIDFQSILDFATRASNHFMNMGTLKPIIKNMDGHEVQYNPIHNNQLGWFTFQSNQLTGVNGYGKGEISHRFYITAQANIIAKFSEQLLKEFEKRKLPFYFKINTSYTQGPKDFIVIYASTQELDNTLSVINHVANHNQELIRQMNPPHEFTNNIDSWIGYAQENKQLQGQESFTGLLSDEISRILVSAVQEWVTLHPTMSVRSNGIQAITSSDLVNKKLLDDNGKDYYRAKNDKIAYYQGISYLLSAIPRVEPNFVNTIVQKLRNSLSEKHINPDNIALNEDVMKELNLIKPKSKVDKDDLRKQIATDSDTPKYNTQNTKKELEEARKMYIKMLEEPMELFDAQRDGTQANDREFPTQRNGIRR